MNNHRCWRAWSRGVRRCWFALPLLATAPRAAHAEGPGLSARLDCTRAAVPGRIVCELTANASSGKLVWVDALVVQAPPFARPLRSRVVARLDSTGAASAKLALVASEVGTGKLRLSVRGVLCHEGAGGEWCGPELAVVSALIEVGQGAVPP